ncbi:unnamed protein product [Penicillium salamii]|nr:unnamed protein product [Penicillium salamii]
MRRHRARHTKSRNGCNNCKSRHVKCDELQPACGTCASRGEPCSYPRPRAPVKKLRRSRIPLPGDERPGDDDGSPVPGSLASSDGCPQFSAIKLGVANTTFPASLGDQPHEQGSLAMDDLKLLQYYHLHTASGMSLHPRRVMVWQRIIPELAVKNRYLMHLVLALAGIHMITNQAKSGSTGVSEESDTVDLATVEEHHQSGLEGFREEVSCISSTNAGNVLAGSLLLVGYAFASLKVQKLNSITDGPEEIQWAARNSSTFEILRLSWLYLNRGISSVIFDKWNVLKASRLRQMVVFPHSEEFWNDFEFDAPSSRISRCSSRLLKFAEGAGQAVADMKVSLDALDSPKDDLSNRSDTPNSQPSPSMTSDWLLDAHLEALGTLDRSYSRIIAVLQCAATDDPVDAEIQMDFEEAAVLSWPVLLPSPFLLSLQESEHNFLHGHSLVLLAHFYLINTLVDSWFLRGSFEREVLKLNALVGTLNDSSLSRFMIWPTEVVAMSPNLPSRNSIIGDVVS